jgi:hypothetical protein
LDELAQLKIPRELDLATFFLPSFIDWACASKLPFLLWKGLVHCKLAELLRQIWKMQGLVQQQVRLIVSSAFR